MIELEWQLLEAGYCLHPEASTLAGGRWSVCQYPALVALLRHPVVGHVLFDTGYSRHFLAATEHLPESLYRRVTPVRLQPEQSVVEQLRRKGIDAGDIACVFVSHFHGDHVGGLGDFPESRVVCARSAWEDLHGRSRWSALSIGLLPALAPASLHARLTFVEDASEIALPPELAPLQRGWDLFGDQSLIAVALPGHAVGQHGLCFHSGGRWILLVADAAWSSRAIREDLPPPRWATAWLGNSADYRRTLSALHALAVARPDVLIVPSHCLEFRP